MKNLWSDQEARSYVRRYAGQGVNADLALRVYTTRLLGNDPRLVLHGGGNTSVKTTVRDIDGRDIEVLCVKGSGWDMGDIEPAGLPAVRLQPLREVLALDGLSDEEMVNVQRRNLLDSKAPNPSVETLLHAALPHKFVDHTHSTAVLALTDQPDGEDILREVYGDRVALVPYVMPGFGLAKACAQVFAANPDVEGMVLLKHGIFSFGESAEEAYGRMIRFVTMAEKRLRTGRRKTVFPAAGGGRAKLAKVSDIAPALRGMLALPGGADGKSPVRFVMDFRTSPAIRRFVDGKDLARYSQQGTVTPDHAIRIKPWPVILPAPKANDIDGFLAGARKAIDDYKTAYRAYFERNNDPKDPRKPLDPVPRVLLVPGLGFFAVGESAKAASIAGDVYENNVEVITDAEAIGRFESITEPETFDIEHWSLEQAKLGSAKEKGMARRIVVVTGAGGAIGTAIARRFRNDGAEVALLDLDAGKAEAAAKEIGGGFPLACDVTDDRSVAKAFAAVVERFGGVDILVSNAGAAWQGRIGEVDDKVLRQSFELNFFAHQRVAQAAVAVMLQQKTGGVLLFNTSKQAVNPGRNFGPYGLPKAATLFLSRQYALDYGADGIRTNAVNADRIRSGLLTDEMIASRSKARGVSREDYMAGNLLGREVTADDVARAFLDLALAEKTTAAVLTVDGGNIEAALR